MLQGLPEFLWEYAVNHSSYLHNQTYTRALNNKTPYEKRFKKKPNVSHLREFGAPVWVLLQGQKVPRKMEFKSRRQVFVGYDDGSKSVKYYNAETCKILTSRNFHFLSLTDETPPEPIAITPDAPGEGEPEGSTQPQSGNQSDSLKRKRTEEKEPQNQRCTRGIRIDYRYLQNSFPDEEDEANATASSPDEETSAIIAGDEQTSLKDAKQSEDWPEWEKAVQVELTQLQHMGTWRLVEKAPNAIPLANKWTFVRKRNKAGEIVKHKARLVVKGCAQRLGYDYVETFSPVV